MTPGPSLGNAPAVKEVLRSNDPVRLSWAHAVLAEAGIEAVRLDEHTSALEGSIGAIPRRIVVAEAEWDRARRVLLAAEAELDDGAP